MKKILFVFAAMVLFVSSNVFAGDVTLTTYYPAPFGMYQEMRVMGNLGVGSTNPASKVDIATGSNVSGLRLRGVVENAEIGDIYMGSEGQMIFSTKNGTDSSRYIDLRPEDNAYGVIIRESDGTSTTPYANLYVVDAVDDYFSINVNSVTDGDALVVAASNNIGIGTTSPKARLHVREEGTGGVDEIARFGSYNSDLPSVIIGSESSAPGLGYLSLYRAEVSLPKVRITASDTVSTYFNSGNVGIGTTNPTEALDINGQVRIRGGSPAEGNVLTSDANGVGTWQAAGGGNVNRVILFALKWNGSQLVHQKTLILSTNVPGDLTKNVVVYGTTTPTYGHYVVPVSFAGFYIDSADIVSASLVELSEVPLKVTITNTLGYNRLEFIISKDKNHHSLTTNSTIYFMCTWPSLR